jgi:hypothetical protein
MTAEEAIIESVSDDMEWRKLMMIFSPTGTLGRYIFQAMKIYAAGKCREQRELCAENVLKVFSHMVAGERAAIENAPEPKYD